MNIIQITRFGLGGSKNKELGSENKYLPLCRMRGCACVR